MKSKRIMGLVLTVLLIGTLTLAFNIQPAKASGTIYIKADGSVDPDTAPISSVDNVTYTFTDNISDTYGIIVERSNIIVDGNGYTLQGSGSVPFVVYGFYLSGISNVTIQNVNITGFGAGISLEGSDQNKIFGNNITNNGFSGFGAIYLSSSSNNTISGNNITNNEYGIRLDSSSNNTLRNNDVTNNEYNFGVYGSLLSHYIQDIDDSNIVNGKPVYYWVNRRDMTVPLDAGYAALVNCTRMTVKNLNLTNSGQAVLLALTTNSTINKNTITNSNDGIYLDHSSNNILRDINTIDNNVCGVYLYASSDNTLTSINGKGASYGLGAITLDFSNSNILTDINASNNGGNYGVYLKDSSNNLLRSIEATDDYRGIYLRASLNNTIANVHANITDNYEGFADTRAVDFTDYSDNNTLVNSTLSKYRYGLTIEASSSNNRIYHNNFIDCEYMHARVLSGLNNVFDLGPIIGGNYWSGHVCIGNPSNGSQPYLIDEWVGGIDHYPFQDPNGWLLPPAPVGGIYIPVNKLELLAPYVGLTILLVVAVITVVYVKKRKRNSEINS